MLAALFLHLGSSWLEFIFFGEGFWKNIPQVKQKKLLKRQDWSEVCVKIPFQHIQRTCSYSVSLSCMPKPIARHSSSSPSTPLVRWSMSHPYVSQDFLELPEEIFGIRNKPMTLLQAAERTFNCLLD